MPIRLICLFIILFVALFISISVKADAPEGSAIPPDQWESHTDAGIAVAIKLYVETTKDQKQVNHLIVYIKNTSTIKKYFLAGGTGDGLLFFYTDTHGVKQYLQTPSGIFNSTADVPINPGQILSPDIVLTSNEMTLVISQPMQSRFLITDPKLHEIITSPQKVLFIQ